MFNKPYENTAFQLPKGGLLRVVVRHRFASKVGVLIESGTTLVRKGLSLLRASCSTNLRKTQQVFALSSFHSSSHSMIQSDADHQNIKDTHMGFSGTSRFVFIF